MDDSSLLKKPPYLAIIILFSGTMVAFLNNSLINIALPTIMKDLDISDYSTVQWLVTAYMLVSGVLMPASAFLITKFSNRKLFITTMSIFGIGTLLASFAPNFGLLLTGRIVQAIGSASVSPLLMNVLLISFPKKKRGMVMGFFGLAMIVAPSIGPTLSGFIIENYDWHLLFIIILPIVVISVGLSIWKLENILPTKEVTLDYVSLILSTIGFGSMLYGFSSAGSKGWADPWVYGTIIFGLIGVISFILRQLRIDNPMLDLRVFKFPIYSHAILLSALIAVVMNSFLILIPTYMQTVRGISPMIAGLMMFPAALIMGVMSPVTGKLFDKFGPRNLVFVGLVITTVATYFMSGLQVDTSSTFIVLIYSLRMFGLSMVVMPVMTNGLNQLPPNLNPHGTATNSTASQVAGSLGSAIIITIMNTTTKERAAELAAKAQAKFTQSGTVPSAEQVVQMKETLMKTALLDGLNHSFLIILGISLIAIFVSLFLKRSVSNQNTETYKNTHIN